MGFRWQIRNFEPVKQEDIDLGIDGTEQAFHSISTAFSIYATKPIGTLDLARDFGCLPTYHLRRFQAAAFHPAGTNRGDGQVY